MFATYQIYCEANPECQFRKISKLIDFLRFWNLYKKYIFLSLSDLFLPFLVCVYVCASQTHTHIRNVYSQFELWLFTIFCCWFNASQKYLKKKQNRKLYPPSIQRINKTLRSYGLRWAHSSVVRTHFSIFVLKKIVSHIFLYSKDQESLNPNAKQMEINLG